MVYFAENIQGNLVVPFIAFILNIHPKYSKYSINSLPYFSKSLNKSISILFEVPINLLDDWTQ